MPRGGPLVAVLLLLVGDSTACPGRMRFAMCFLGSSQVLRLGRGGRARLRSSWGEFGSAPSLSCWSTLSRRRDDELLRLESRERHQVPAVVEVEDSVVRVERWEWLEDGRMYSAIREREEERESVGGAACMS